MSEITIETISAADVATLRQLAEATASTVGSKVLARRRAGFSWETKSTSTDVVTEIDTWAESAVVDLLMAARPDDGLIGEEGASTPSKSGVTWVIDPIDGTTNLLYDIPGFSVSIGAEVDGTAVAGAVYDPIRDELFSAGRNQGATRSGEPISASSKADIATALVGTGFSYSADDRSRQAVVLQTVLPRVRDIRRLGGAALDLCAVGCGRFDAWFERGLSHWDWSAGALVAHEAGATVAIGDLTYAIAPDLAEAFLELLEQARV